MASPSLPFFPPFEHCTAPPAVGDRWRRWIDRFENLLVALQIASAAQKKALLLHYIGEETYDVYASLTPAVPGSLIAPSSSTSSGDASQPDEYEQVKKRLHDHFTPKINREYEIEKQLNKKVKRSTISTLLCSLARYRSFTNLDSEIKSQIVLGTTSTKLRWFALQTDATL